MVVNIAVTITLHKKVARPAKLSLIKDLDASEWIQEK